MKIFPLLPLALAAAAMCFTGGCKKADNSELAHHHHHHGHEGHDHDHEGHNHEHEGHDHEHEGHDHEGHEHEGEENHGDDVITLSPEQAELFHVTATPAQMMSIGNVIKVGGTLTASTDGNAIVSAPIAGVVTYVAGINPGSEVHAGSTVATVKSGVVSGTGANDVAKAELEAARAELDRLKPLYEKRLVTQARYNEAVAAYERARAAYSAPAAGGRATSPISGVIVSVDAASGAFVAAGAPLAALASASGLTLRADVPVRYSSSLAGIVDARIVDPSNGHSVTVSSVGN
ncbi:MAG: HlyD family efflux transporter periplasmic adaptor subunit [Muribaculaceae bacterium]|nr:HlyD family efflux transporter periplasmic adaptor subunit [Muribaculaceae bacterium]